MNLRRIITLALMLCAIPVTHAICDREVKNEINRLARSNPYEIYAEIQHRFKNVLFIVRALGDGNVHHDSFTTTWDDFAGYLECAHQYIQAQMGSIAVPEKLYKANIVTLTNVTKFINQFVLSVIMAQDTKKSLTTLKSKKLEVTEYLKKLPLINASALQHIHITDIIPPASWQKSVGATYKIIFPQYEQFFKNYDAIKQQVTTKTKPLTPKEIIYFLSLQKIIKIDPKSPKVEMNSVAALIELLEKIKHRAEEEKKKAWFSRSEPQKIIDSSNEIINALIMEYPGVTTNLMYEKMLVTKNVPALILAAESESLYTILQYILQYIESL